jgi:predicted DNA-binding transcriptional regulator YafY
MRFQKAKALLDLAIVMRLSHRGISIAEIQERYGCCRRTAQRMRDAVWDLFPLEESARGDISGEDCKRWRVTRSNVDLFINQMGVRNN